jgi:hypothetical protein
MTIEETSKEQADRFKEAAREAECDEDKARWEERLRRVAKASRQNRSESGGEPDAQ